LLGGATNMGQILRKCGKIDENRKKKFVRTTSPIWNRAEIKWHRNALGQTL